MRNEPRRQGAPTNGSRSAEPQKAPVSSDPIEMLSADHRNVEKLFDEFTTASTSQHKTEIVKQICLELIVHTQLEEEIFYPACQGQMEKRLLDEAQVEHDAAKALIIELQNGSPDDQYFDAKVKVLSEEIKQHVREEENPGEGIFAKAKEAGVATAEIAKRLATRKRELMDEAQANALGPPKTRSFLVRMKGERSTTSQENQMARGSGTMERERDDQGRFVGDDDRDYRGRSGGRSRYNDDDNRRYARARDDEGRFTSGRSRSRDDDDDDRRYGRARDDEGRFTSNRSRSRYDEEDGDYRSGGRDHGGWFGDPEGHSRASREGWRHSAHDGSGWYSDPEGHSRASREGWRRSDHEGSGWYGDPEGHSRASREGWEDRGRGGARSRYDDDHDPRYARARDDEGRFTSSRSRSRYGEDEDRPRGRGHGGWYGDPEGHAEAARQRRR
jgi:hypothetical protein